MCALSTAICQFFAYKDLVFIYFRLGLGGEGCHGHHVFEKVGIIAAPEKFIDRVL